MNYDNLDTYDNWHMTAENSSTIQDRRRVIDYLIKYSSIYLSKYYGFTHF